MNKGERSPSLEKDHLHLNHGSPTADELPMCNSESATNDLLSFLQFAAPEMINVAIKEEKPVRDWFQFKWFLSIFLKVEYKIQLCFLFFDYS